MRVYILIGAPGAGKTTWSQKNFSRLDAVLVSTDTVRNQLAQKDIADTNFDLIYNKVNQALDKCLINNENVIIDGTNAKHSWRKNHIRTAKRYRAYLIAVWLGTPFEQCLINNDKRNGVAFGERPVSHSEIYRTYRNIDPPTIDEGFDEIWLINTESNT